MTEKTDTSNHARLMLGCMSLSAESAHRVVDTALDCGIYRFDHADIYRGGAAEQAFGQVLRQRPELRNTIELQSKCGIRFADETGPNRYDFSASWITQSVEGILQRLGIEQLDTLLLHRPDPLMEADEVAQALVSLHEAGKVVKFGVSNMNHHQIRRLQRALPFDLVANQLEMGLHQLDWLDEGITVGSKLATDSRYAAGTLEHCIEHAIELQAWSPLSRGKYVGTATAEDPPEVHKTAERVADLARQYNVSGEAICLAWVMRHPAAITPVIGTTNAERIRGCAQALDLELSREQWYSLYVSARGQGVP